MTIKVSIIDDHPLATSGISNMLKEYEEINIVGIYHNLQTLLENITHTQPDILLMDIILPNQSGKDLVPIIKKDFPDVRIIALTSLDAPTMISGMMRRGCKGYLLKDTDQKTLYDAIIAVAGGEEFIEPSLKEKMVQNLFNFSNHASGDRNIPEITLREKEILQLIADELTTQEIADKLFISFRTVENHRYSLMQKLVVKNTVGLIKIAIKLGLVDVK